MPNQDLGDRMKFYEKNGFNSTQLIPYLPFVLRIDGKAFHSFTSNLHKPMDWTLQDCFSYAISETIKEFNPILTYHQSDEISLFFYYPNYKSELPFGGKVFKLTSVICSYFTAVFNNRLKLYDKLKSKIATFDCRVIQLPNLIEAHNYYLWRYRDCVKNSISSLASSHFPHSELQGLNQAQRKDKLYSEKGIAWEDSEDSFKNGTLTFKGKSVDTSVTFEKFEEYMSYAKQT